MARLSVLALAFALVAAPAWAEPTADVDQADALFQEGRALMDRGELAAACPKLQKSFQLSPRLGTMLNLGACFEKNGQLARSLAIYERAATVAREAGRPDRERAARELAAAVEPRVARLLLVFDERVVGLTVDVDGETVSLQGGLLPLDPGERRLVARAPGKSPYAVTLAAHAGETLRLNLRGLKDEPTLSPPVIEGPALVARPNTARTVGVVVGLSAVVAGAAIGAGFGLEALSKRNQSDPHCDSTGCDSAGETLIHQARTDGDVSTVAFAFAGAGLVGAAALLLFAPRLVTPSVGVVVGPTGAAIHAAF